MERALLRLLPHSLLAPLRAARAAAEALQAPLPSEQPLREPVEFSRQGEISVPFLMSASQGLYSYQSGRLERLLAGKNFGLTRRRGRCYAYRQNSRKYSGEIISFRLLRGNLQDLRLERPRVGLEVHQILAFEDSLYVTETRNNRLDEYRIHPAGLRKARSFHPGGLFSRRDVHLNSITEHQGQFFVLYHNRTAESGRRSQIAVLDRRLRFSELIPIEAGSAHNIAFPRGELTYCDSDGRAVICGNRRFDIGYFTRGLAVDGQVLLVGASEVGLRHERANSTGRVFALDLDTGRIAGELTIPGIGNIRDLILNS